MLWAFEAQIIADLGNRLIGCTEVLGHFVEAFSHDVFAGRSTIQLSILPNPSYHSLLQIILWFLSQPKRPQPPHNQHLNPIPNITNPTQTPNQGPSVKKASLWMLLAKGPACRAGTLLLWLKALQHRINSSGKPHFYINKKGNHNPLPQIQKLSIFNFPKVPFPPLIPGESLRTAYIKRRMILN